MKETRATVGTGITRRTRISRVPEDIADMHQLMSGMSVKPYPEYLTDIEGVAKATLHKAGLPCEWGAYRRKGDRWIQCKPGEKAGPQLGLNTLIVEKLGHAIDSPHGYAVRILQTCRIIRAAFEKAQINTVARYAQQLGEMISESSLKWRFEWVALKGAASHAGSELGARARAAPYVKRNRELALKFKEFTAAHPGVSRTQAMIRVGRYFGLSAETARKAVAKGLKEIG